MRYDEAVKLTAKVNLQTTRDQFEGLKALVKASNAACNWISEQAWNAKEFSPYGIHKLTYRQARERFGLQSQIAIRCISKVGDAYKLDKNTQRTFRPLNAIAFDDRCLRWYVAERTVSIASMEGRLKIQFAAGDRQLALLANRQGESDLILNKGAFYLAATCNAEEPEPDDVDDFLGVDFGVANIASDSDGRRHSGSAVKSVRYRQRRLRRKLQKLGTTSANRRLKKLADKESRFARHVNHVVSKQIIASAKGTGRGIAIEELGGIRDRVKVGRKQRVVLHSWAFFQLRLFLEYKARLSGVPLIAVNPRNSSRECSQCHDVSKLNRPNQSTFRCRACGHHDHADTNAAMNLRARGRAAVNPPNAAVGF